MDNLHNPSLLVDAPFEKDRVDGGFSLSKMDCSFITDEDINHLIKEIEAIQNYYSEKNEIEGVVVSVRYKRIAPKSNRIRRLLCHYRAAYETTIGAKFEEIKQEDKVAHNHVVTHFLNKAELSYTLEELKESSCIIKSCYNSTFYNTYLEKGNREKQSDYFKGKRLAKTNFFQIMCDVSYIKDFLVLTPLEKSLKNEILVTFFPIPNLNLEVFLRSLGVEGSIKILDKNNAILSNEQYQMVYERAPYIICMDNDDFSLYQIDDSQGQDNSCGRILPKLDDSIPTIGVFDTIIERENYLSPYIQFENLVSDEYYEDPLNCVHGTKVDSLIIEGNRLNPKYEDDCGLFRVIHFGVGGKGKIEIDVLFKAIEEKVREHSATVKVWNLSLGDELGIHPNYVSLLGAKIDEVSKKYNVLFIIAGTNISKKYKDMIIGSPADSFNSIVVNSVKSVENPVPASYSRKGPVLTFFQKPDIAYYGGDEGEELSCYSPNFDYFCKGTSFAAPLIARKAAYLIHKAHFTVECAKALIIDSAYGWRRKYKNADSLYVGYGVPAISIKDIIGSKKDEIKIVIHGRTIEQNTLVHDIPIILDDKKKFNYGAKLVFCYFVDGNRNQGVDYTEQEISVKFGLAERKLNKKDGRYHYVVDSINKDKQGSSDGLVMEGHAIEDFGKWNNTKVLVEGPGQQKKAKEYNVDVPFWGISIQHLNRFGTISKDTWNKNPDSVSAKFGIVATFKTIDGTDSELKEYIRRLRANTNYRVREIDFEIENDVSIKENETLTIE